MEKNRDCAIAAMLYRDWQKALREHALRPSEMNLILASRAEGIYQHYLFETRA
jgi:hypothetical protein